MNQVQFYREAAALSQKELADKSGCSQPTIVAIEAGGKTNVYLAQRIANALGATVREVFPPIEAEEPKPNSASAA